MRVRFRKAKVRDAPAIARVYVDTWRTAYAGLLPQEYLASLDYEEEVRGCRAFLEGDQYPRMVCVAEAGSRVVGYVVAGPNNEEPEEYEAEIYEIFVLPSYTRKGIGTRLMQRATDWCASLGYASLVIWCWKDNPFACFYWSLGGKVVRTCTQTVANRELDVLVFGWQVEELQGALQPRLVTLQQTERRGCDGGACREECPRPGDLLS